MGNFFRPSISGHQLMGVMMINQWIEGYPIFRQTHLAGQLVAQLCIGPLVFFSLKRTCQARRKRIEEEAQASVRVCSGDSSQDCRFFCQSKTLSRLNAEAPKLKNDGLHDMTVAYCSIVACEQVADERIMQARNRPRSHIVGDSSVSRILVSPNTLYHCQNG